MTAGSLSRPARQFPWFAVVPALVACMVGRWGLSSPSYWRDEAATVQAARFPLPDLFQLVRHVDAVHALYYAFMHVWIGVFGGGEVAARLPSLIGTVAAAAGTALLGRRLAGTRVGLLAGLVVALSPTVSEYTELARSYTLVMALGVLVAHLYLTALSTGERRAFACYAAGLALLGAAHLFALLIVVPHAVLLYGRGRVIVRRWAAAVAGVLLATAPLIRLAGGQSHVIAWVPRPDLTALRDLVGGLAGSTWTAVPVVLLVALGLTGPSGGARWFAAAWAVLPPAVLVVVSFVHPVYVFRYVLICVPAWALLAALGLDRLRAGRGRLLPVAAAGALLVGLSVPRHLEIRREDSRQDDLRLLARIISAHRQPGDAVLYCRNSYRHIGAAYPAVFHALRDLALGGRPQATHSLNGHDVSTAILEQRLTTVQRVWYIQTAKCPAAQNRPEVDRYDLVARSPSFRPSGTWRYKGGTAYLYTAGPATP